MGASLYVLVAKGDLVFTLKGSGRYERLFEFADEASEIYRRLAYDLDRLRDGNDAKLERLRLWFQIAILALAVEVALLLVSVGGTLVQSDAEQADAASASASDAWDRTSGDQRRRLRPRQLAAWR